jgi:hypothetical protein
VKEEDRMTATGQAYIFVGRDDRCYVGVVIQTTPHSCVLPEGSLQVSGERSVRDLLDGKTSSPARSIPERLELQIAAFVAIFPISHKEFQSLVAIAGRD